jgi:hypothetical protein
VAQLEPFEASVHAIFELQCREMAALVSRGRREAETCLDVNALQQSHMQYHNNVQSQETAATRLYDELCMEIILSEDLLPIRSLLHATGYTDIELDSVIAVLTSPEKTAQTGPTSAIGPLEMRKAMMRLTELP